MPATAATSAASTSSRIFLGYAACALAGCFWGMGFYFGKIALAEMGVGHMVLYRFLFACLPLIFMVRKPRFTRRDWALLLAATFLGIPVQYLIQFYGLSLTTVSHAALMVGTMPVILAVGASIFTHERLDAVGWFALAGSTAGVAMIVLSTGHTHTSGRGPTLAGDSLIVGSLLIALAWILLNKRLMEHHSPMQVTSYGILIGTAMIAAWVLLEDGLPPVHGISTRAWLALLASGLLCNAAAMLLWNTGIHRVPASRAGVFLNIEPALGSVLGVKLLGEHLGTLAWVGGGLILAAAITLTSGGKGVEEVIVE